MTPSLPPRWQDLLAHFLRRPQDLPAIADSEVEPYQAQPALGLDLSTAWQDALLPGTMLGEAEDQSYPDGWQQTRTYLWATPFPCCVGLAPQFLQQIQGLMQDARRFFQSPVELKATSSCDHDASLSWLGRLAEARVTGDFATVAALLKEEGHPKALVQNERAAQAWLQGDRATASRLWKQLPDEQPVVAFNQALIALSQNDFNTGRDKLRKAAAGFPETSGWRHLAELYRVALGD